MSKPDYVVSLPERAVRALAALGGGFITEGSNLLLPAGIRRSRLYQVTVGRLLRLIVELLGDVKGRFPEESLPVGDLMRRKTAGNLIELASFLAVGWSPIWLLAAASDLAGGTRSYLQALVQELIASKVLPPETEIESFEQLLSALEGSSGALADTIDVLPTSVEELRSAWNQLGAHVNELPDAGRLAALFEQLQHVAEREQRPILEVSGLIALGALRAGLQLGTTHLFDYYRDALSSIASEGLPRYLRRISAPYFSTAVSHFDQQRETLTQQLIRRFRGGGK